MKESKTIFEACRSGDLEQVQRLVVEDATLVDADDEHEWRPIFHASLRKHVDVVRFLLQCGADVAAHDGYVLHYAAEVPNNREIVTLLVLNGALEAHLLPTDDLSRQLCAAIYLGNVARVGSLLKRHAQLTDQLDGRGDQPIHHAARNGETEIVRRLLESGANVNATSQRGHTVLYCAAGHGHLSTVELLLDNNVDIAAKFTSDGKDVLEWLAQYPDEPMFVDVAAAIMQA